MGGISWRHWQKNEGSQVAHCQRIEKNSDVQVRNSGKSSGALSDSGEETPTALSETMGEN
jgi:hypothetical protein